MQSFNKIFFFKYMTRQLKATETNKLLTLIEMERDTKKNQ